MLSSEIIAKIKALDLKGRHVATDLMSGHYMSAFHGRGMEFHEVREYVPGDDIRGIDWNVTARMNQPYIKVFKEERELTLMIIVDVSASMNSGEGRSRRAAASELSAILAWLAIRSNDRVGLLLFSDVIELFLPPRKGQGHVWRIIRDVYTWSCRSKGTNINGALDHVAKMLKRRAVCFVISDFLTNTPHKSLSRIARQHDVTLVNMSQGILDGIFSKSDAKRSWGISSLIDRETGQLVEIDLSKASVRHAIVEAHEVRVKSLETSAQKMGCQMFCVKSNESVVDALSGYLRRVEPKRRRS